MKHLINVPVYYNRKSTELTMWITGIDEEVRAIAGLIDDTTVNFIRNPFGFFDCLDCDDIDSDYITAIAIQLKRMFD